jgi:hypothetical protein
MNISALRIGYIAIGLLAPVAFTMRGASAPPAVEQGHLSGMTAKITLPDGATRSVKLEGVGCSASLCSRTAIKGKGEHDSIVRTWFDTIAAIRDATDSDALFIMRDGTQRRMFLMADFRVLYLANPSGATEKLDLARVKSIEFFAPSK